MGKENVDQVREVITPALVTSASAVNPILGGIVGTASALFGIAMARRKDRVEQFISFFRDNKEVVSDNILSSEVFQDGVIFLIEKHLRERNDEKRVILQRILLGYAEAPDLLDFPLEEMADLVSRIRMSDVAVFREALTSEMVREDGRHISFMVKCDPNAVSRLIYFGLLHEDRSKNGPAIREYDDKEYLYVWVSPAGREFAKYLGMPPIDKKVAPSIGW